MKYIILLALLSFESRTSHASTDIDKGLVKYVTEFKQEASSRGLNEGDFNKIYFIRFENLGFTNVRGRCTVNEDGSREIRIDWRAREDLVTLKVIMFHELGHCVYNLKHDKQELEIMFAEIDYTPNYYKNWNSLLDHMFSKVGE